MEIRTATIDDLSSIFHLGETLFTSQEVSNLYRTWDEFEVTGLFNQEPEHVIVAHEDNRVVGFVMGTTIEKARTAWNYGHLLWLGIAPSHSRQGIGGMLFDRFRERMEEKNIRMLLVDTQADNEPALEFFKSRGFENPTAHVYMTLNLQRE